MRQKSPVANGKGIADLGPVEAEAGDGPFEREIEHRSIKRGEAALSPKKEPAARSEAAGSRGAMAPAARAAERDHVRMSTSPLKALFRLVGLPAARSVPRRKTAACDG